MPADPLVLQELRQRPLLWDVLMDILDIDIESYSTVNLKKANVYAYTECPEFEIVMCSWGLNDGPVEVVDSHEEFQDRLREIPGLWDPDVKKVAHNAGFERVCFSRFAGMPIGQYLPPEEWFDTAAVAAEYGLPRSLEAVAKFLKIEQKDSAGTRLINLFCMPQKGRRVRPEEEPEKWAEFLAYCQQDTVVARAVRHKLKRWPNAFERDLWYADQRINDRGMKIDIDLATRAVDAAKANAARDSERLKEIANVAPEFDGEEDDDGSVAIVENANSTKQLGAWCESRGFPMPNWKKDTVKDALMRSDVPEDVREVLELRQELALVAHRKFEAALRGVSGDGRLRGQFVFHAAHTARWSSRGVQVHNLAKLGFVIPGTDEYDEIAEGLALDALLYGRGADPTTLKMLVRPMFLGPLGVSDLSAIEARVLAWIAGEEWVLEAFRLGRDLYVETADRMGDMGRPEGKIAVLAGGYQGAVGSLRNMGYGGRVCPRDTLKANTKGMTPDEADRERERVRRLQDEGHLNELLRDPKHKDDVEVRAVVDAYRSANPKIVAFWYEMQEKFWTGGVVGAGKVRIEVDGLRRKVHLPSGRYITYHNVRKQRTMEVDRETGEKHLSERRSLTYRHVRGYQEKTYGGRLTENVTQAIARDFLAEALVKMDRAGYPVVGHVHDEALNDFEGYEPEQVEEMVAFIHHTMRTPPEWASDMPLDASIGVLERYRKD